MKIIIKSILLSILIIGIGYNQDDYSMQNIIDQGHLNNKLVTNQNFSFIYSNSNGLPSSMGIFSNRLNYRINDNLNIRSNIHFLTPMVKTMDNKNNLMVNYDLNINYQFSESINFNVIFSNAKIHSNNKYILERSYFNNLFTE